jgi:DASH complex subunit Duo1
MADYSDPSATERHQQFDQSDIDEDLWTSPTKTARRQQPPQKNTLSRTRDASRENKDAREEALRKELESVRKINEAIEGAIESLAKARNSMKVGVLNTTE